MTTEVYIYALIDPLDGAIRYVGKSVDVPERITSHLREARQGSPVHSRRWLARLIKKGNRPEMMLLDICDTNEQANTSERWWIKKLRALGANLTNCTPGGDGQPKGYSPSRSTIEKTRAKLRGQKRTEEQRQRLKDAFNKPEVKARRRAVIEELKKNNPEWLAKVRKGRTGIRNSKETIQRMKESWTPERRNEQSARMKNKPITERHKEQLAAALKTRWEKYGNYIHNYPIEY